jgi:sialate O-acetylesterase
MNFIRLTVACLSLLSIASAAPIRVACLGDSLTQGAKVDAATESYPARLQEMLGPEFEVKNFGQGGATMIRKGGPTIFGQLPAAAEFQPQIAIVNFGINDTRSRGADYWTHFDEFPADTNAALNTLLDLPTHPIVLLCIPTANFADLPGMEQERRENVGERLPRLVEVRAKLREIAASFAARGVVLVDLYAVTEKHPEVVNIDGVHLTPEGYRLLAETLRPQVEAAAKKLNTK